MWLSGTQCLCPRAFMYCSPNSQGDCIWRWSFLEVIKVKCGYKGWALI